MARDLANCVVVITGASSGIGRAAAQQFALEGSRLVLAARAEGPLREAVGECERLGATALAVATDVRDESAVQALAARAVERLGRLDVWVNGAGVMAYGRFEEIPSEVFRAIIETNLFGQVHGARAALAHFHEQRTGVLINLCSVWGRVTAPDVSAYVTSKFAVRAFGECLRQELRDLPEVDVATMLPQAVDTPIFARAGNYSGKSVRPIPPIVDPEEVARAASCAAQSRPSAKSPTRGWGACWSFGTRSSRAHTTVSCPLPSKPAITPTPSWRPLPASYCNRRRRPPASPAGGRASAGPSSGAPSWPRSSARPKACAAGPSQATRPQIAEPAS